MVPAGVLRGLLVAACVWLAVACVDDSEINELIEEGWSHEEVFELLTIREAEEELREPWKCYQPEENVVYNHPSVRLAAARAKKVIEQHRQLFRRQPNWWSHGITAIQDENGQETDQLGVVIWVSQKVAQSELPEADRIPDCIGEVPIEIREEKKPDIEKLSGRTARHRPLMAGVQLFTPHTPPDVGKGTLTGIARRNAAPHEKVMVTCLHVLTGDGNEDNPTRNQAVHQIDTANVADRVGELVDWVPMSKASGNKNIADAAVCS